MKKFESKQKDYFALAFSDYRLKLALVNRQGKLKAYFSKELPLGVIERGEVKKPKTLALILKKFLKKTGIKKKFVVVGLPEIKAFTRALVLPPLSLEELGDAARWEAEPLLPFPLDQAYLDWQLLEKTDTGTRLLVVALPAKLVETYAKILEKLGLLPVAFETTSLSLARLVHQEGKTTIGVEVKPQEALIVIVGPNGGVEVSATVSFRALKEAQEEILETLRHTISFYHKRLGGVKDGRKISQLYLCGSQAKESLAALIKKELSLPARVLKTKNLGRVVTISLARKEVDAPKNEESINLIPPRIQGFYDQATRVTQISNWLKLTLLLLFLVFFAHGVLWARFYFFNQKIEKEIIQLQAKISPEVKQLEAQAGALNRHAKMVASLNLTSPKLGILFTQAREAVLEGITLSALTYQGENDVILVDGLAEQRDNLLAYRENLEKTEGITRVHLPLSNLEKEANIRFTLTLIREGND